MKKAVLFFFLALTVLHAQNNQGVISGTVIDATSKQPLPFANVFVIETGGGAATDLDGKYSITRLEPGSYRVRVSAVGYTTVTKTDITVSNAKPAVINFELMPSVIELEGVTVTSDYFSRSLTEINSVTYFGYEEIRRAPGGFEDVVRALSILPGVAVAEAGRNDLIVRGGAPSENLYLVDGFEVPNINHFGNQGATGGPLSFINLDFVDETSFATGGFPVMYGDKLSSVLQIKLREGRNDRAGGKATISASQFGLNLETPVTSNSSLLFSARRSYLDFIFKAAGFGFVPEYYDVLGKYSWNIDKTSKLSYLFVSAFDNVRYFNETEDQRFENSRVLGSDQIQYLTGLSYRKLFSNGFFDVLLSRNFTDFNTSQRDSLLNPIFLNESLEAENKLKAEAVLKFGKKTELNIGGDIKLIKFRADIKLASFRTTFGDILPLDSTSVAQNFLKGGLFANYTYMLTDRMTANAGVRLDYFDEIETKQYISPRFALSYMFSPLFSMNFSAGVYRQSPSYIWLASFPENKRLKSIRTDQYILGFDYRLREDAQLKVEGYYKDYSDYPASLVRPYLVLANTGAGFSGSEDNFSSFGLEPLSSEGTGYARGIEFSIQKKLSDIRAYGIMSFTLGEAKFTARDGIARTGTYDQTVIFNLSGGYKFNEAWEMSMKFRYATAKPRTPFNVDGSQSVALYNTVRSDNPHALDLRVDKRWFFDNLTLITYLDVQNVYNNTKTGSVRWNPREQKAELNSSIGILPSIGVSLEF